MLTIAPDVWGNRTNLGHRDLWALILSGYEVIRLVPPGPFVGLRTPPTHVLVVGTEDELKDLIQSVGGTVPT